MPKLDERRKTRDERRTDAAERGQRALAHYAEPRGGKACKAGLKTRDEGGIENDTQERERDMADNGNGLTPSMAYNGNRSLRLLNGKSAFVTYRH